MEIFYVFANCFSKGICWRFVVCWKEMETHASVPKAGGWKTDLETMHKLLIPFPYTANLQHEILKWSWQKYRKSFCLIIENSWIHCGQWRSCCLRASACWKILLLSSFEKPYGKRRKCSDYTHPPFSRIN